VILLVKPGSIIGQMARPQRNARSPPGADLAIKAGHRRLRVLVRAVHAEA
jgi:hypothetical protein